MEIADSERSKNIKSALDRARQNGTQLGNPNPEIALQLANESRSEQATNFANNHRPVIEYFLAQGLSLRAIARKLNERGVPTLRSNQWQATQIKHIIDRPRPAISTHPFYLEGPAVVSFSGGRTSAFMLKQIIDVAGGTLPQDVKVVFANTGKERPETLVFVQECAENWNIPITWLEFDPTAPHKTKIVDYYSASRHGEPYEALIEKKQFLPNPVIRHCTSKLKVERIEAFARHWCKFKSWRNVIGIRYDEPRRVEKILKKCNGCVFDCSRAGPHSLLPLHTARFIEEDILTWWQNQSFDLQLEPHEGNCDLCFLKGIKKIRKIMAERPDLAEWWIAQESRGLGKTEHTAYFRKDRASYATILQQVQAEQESAPEEDLEYDDCACTD